MSALKLDDGIAEARARMCQGFVNQTDPPSLLEYCQKTFHKPLHEWQEKHLIPLLESFRTTKGRRVIVAAPPQYGKSLLVSQRFPAWLLGVDPTHRLKLACYNITKAAQFGAVITNLMQAEEYLTWFGPDAQIKKGASAEEFSTVARLRIQDAQPSFKALGLETGFTGSGADTLEIDDPYPSLAHALSEAYETALERFWVSTAAPRLTEETNVLGMFHRYHGGDFAQRRIDDGWEYFRFPALGDLNEDGTDPTNRQPEEPLSPMRSKVYLVKLREDDPDTFAGQFQGRPVKPEGAMFKDEYFGSVTDLPPLRRWIRAWDLATSVKKTGDYTVGALVGKDDDGSIIVRDVVRFRAEWPDAANRIIDVAKDDGPSVPVVVEAVQFQLAAIQTLGRNDNFEAQDTTEDFLKADAEKDRKGEKWLRSALIPSYPKGDKKERASGWAWFASRKKLKLAEGEWNQEFIDECKAFDGHGLVHDDQVDAVSAAFALLSLIKGGRIHAPKIFTPGSLGYQRELVKQQRGRRR